MALKKIQSSSDQNCFSTIESIIETTVENSTIPSKRVVDLEHEASISPFDLIGSWDKKTMEGVLVTFSEKKLAHNNVGKKLPSDHYRISSLKFTKACYPSKYIKIDNVLIPFSSEKGYGHDYIYICLPDVIEELVKTNAARQFPNLIASKYYGEAGEWWKPAYDIKGVFKVADKNQICTPVSLEKILNHTKMGVRANIQAEFSVKRRLFSVENIIKVKILKAFITSMGVDIKPPSPVGIIPGRPRQQDITSDDIMQNLETFRDVPS